MTYTTPNGFHTRIYFKNSRSPIFGRIVELNDAADLLKKKMVRFVGQAKSPMFDLTNSAHYTVILITTDLLTIKHYKDGTPNITDRVSHQDM